MAGRILMLIVFCSWLIPAQVRPPEEGAAPAPSEPARQGSQDYQFGPGDLLQITVFGVDELDQTVRVNSSGTITLPLLGRLTVAGLTGEELEAHITSVLTRLQLVKDPQVTVFVKEYRSQPIYVLGAVNQPGQYMVTHQLRLIDALTMAGGLDTRRSADHLFLQRRADGQNLRTISRSTTGLNDRSDVVRIDVKALLENGDESLNLVLQAGDVIQVPERTPEVFYVVGDVMRSGSFPFHRDQRISVLGALAMAGGLGKTSMPEKAVIFREVPGSEKRQEIAINLKQVMRGKAEDIAIRPEDVLVVPTSSRKTVITYVVPGAVAAAVAAALWAGLN